MFKNYIITALRNIKKNPTFSIINITGLAIGMTCSILILLWVQDELRFDSWHSKKDRISRVLVNMPDEDGNPFYIAVTPAALAPNLKKDFPEIEKVCRFKNWLPFLFRYKGENYIEARSGAIDSTAFDLFDFKMIYGDKNTALLDPHSVVLTKTLSEKIFGQDINPLGQILDVKNRGAFKVTGVIEDVKHSHFEFEFLYPFHTLVEDGENIDEMGQGSYNFSTYLLLKDAAQFQTVNKKIKKYLNQFNDDGEEGTAELFIQPLKDIYLKSHFNYDFTRRGDMSSVITFTAIAFLVLLIACINFMNLTTARSSNRAREIGLRKVTGAYRKHIIFQFFGESIFMAALAFFIALLLVGFLIPVFNNLSGKELLLSYLFQPRTIFLIIAVAVITGLIAGSYPAVYLSSFSPLKVLKGKLTVGAKGGILRKTLVVIQFTLSVALIVSTIMISKQMRYIKSKDLGYKKNNLIFVPLNPKLRQNYDALKSQLLSNPSIKNVSTSRVLPVYACPSTSISEWEGKQDDRGLMMHFFPVGFDYFKTMGIDIVEGRVFNDDMASDSSLSFIVNQEAVKRMGMKDPIGKSVTLGNQRGYIIGVMKDYNFNNVKNKIAPLLHYVDPNMANIAFLRIQNGDVEETIDYIEDAWKSFDQDIEFNAYFMNERLDQLYRAEQRSNTLITYFTIFAIFISCLGIFGLASFMAEQRTKEIGVRKVMGSSSSTIVSLFMKEFMKLVFIALLIGWPIAFYAMREYLEGFAYHANLSFWMFLMAGLLTLVVVMITISYQSYVAANKNPAESLRHE